MSRLLAWALCATSALLGISGVVIAAVSDSQRVLFSFGVAVLGVVYPAVGALIASRQPGNAVGWILIAVGGLQGIQSASAAYGYHGLLVADHPWPLAAQLAWIGGWTWVPSLGLMATFLFLLFPDGELPGRRWRVVGRLAAVSIALATGAAAVGLSALPAARIATGDASPAGAVLGLFVASWIGIAACCLASVASLFARYRQAAGVQRQQLKWLAAGGVGTAVGVALSFALNDLDGLAGLVPVIGAFLALPAATGVAILRYRLYDIDRLISRTVTYGLVSALLAGVYLVGVLALGRLLAPVTEGSELAVAGSTLAVAAAFGPVRRRVQSVVDRRFNRSRYDAARTVEAFRSRLRDEVSLDQLSTDLLTVVGQTVQPARVSLWLRGSAT